MVEHNLTTEQLHEARRHGRALQALINAGRQQLADQGAVDAAIWQSIDTLTDAICDCLAAGGGAAPDGWTRQLRARRRAHDVAAEVEGQGSSDAGS